jgi:glycosyltransferase involved in cell wall biosynthesis
MSALRVLMLTQRVDKNDWVTGFTHSWVRALAGRVRHLHVICLARGEADVPPNVTLHSMGKEKGYGRLRELVAFQQAIATIIRQVDVVFGHMIPRYTLAAAPWALAARVPMVQWYTHRQVTLELRMAHRLVRRVVTASPESFQLPSDKVVVLGHGIDTSQFCPSERPPDGRLVVGVGRLAPIKGYEALIEAASLMADARLEIAGGTTPEMGEDYAQQLQQLAQDVGAADRLRFLGIVPHQEMPALYQRARAAVNLCPTGGVDKAVLEGMACGVPTVARNRTFEAIFGEDADLLLCDSLDARELAGRLGRVLSLPDEEWLAMGARLRARVLADHDLNGLMDRLVAVLEEAAGLP